MLTVFYAQPADSIEKETLYQKVEVFRQTMVGLSVEVVAPYLQQSKPIICGYINRDEARSIVKTDLAALDRCDVLVADLSVPGWQFIGVIFEIAYAFLKNKTIIVYTGTCQVGDRTFIMGTANYICSSLAEVRKFLEEIVKSRNDTRLK